MKRLWKLLFPERHLWKETHRENLGEFTHFGNSPAEITTMYRIAVYETCILTGAKRIRSVNGLHPAPRIHPSPTSVSQPI